MQKIFKEVTSLDLRCIKKYHLSEDILMEHAAMSMQEFIEKKYTKNKTILIVCGSGNNGADGIVLARLLYGKYKIKLYIPFSINSDISKTQLKRTLSTGVKITSKISSCDVIVDCLFGSGLNRPLNEKSIRIIDKMNSIKAYKLACDIPSGLNKDGQISNNAFIANTTITMGALKTSLFCDNVKNYIGKIKLANLGVQRSLYEKKSNIFLLEKKDLKLPHRKNTNTNKGTFGHLCVYIGEKKGAGLISCETALSFGVGLITALTSKNNIPNHIMASSALPSNTTAIALGMGMGKNIPKKILSNNIPKVIDADMFYKKEVLSLLDKHNIVLTPHPKEFASLLKMSGIADISIEHLQDNRLKYVEIFCKKYPSVVLLLKGANVIIAQKNEVYINTFGTSALSFGGSGDILSGLIASLLAQKYDAIDAAISGSLAHTLSALHYSNHNYSLNPNDLILQIKKL